MRKCTTCLKSFVSNQCRNFRIKGILNDFLCLAFVFLCWSHHLLLYETLTSLEYWLVCENLQYIKICHILVRHLPVFWSLPVLICCQCKCDTFSVFTCCLYDCTLMHIAQWITCRASIPIINKKNSNEK